MVLEKPGVHAQRARTNKMIPFVLDENSRGSESTGGLIDSLDLSILMSFDSFDM